MSSRQVPRWSDALVFSSVWISLGAGALVAAASGAMQIPFSTHAIALAFCGTLVIYNVDRLRDLERDRQTSPLRSAFVERNRGVLMALTVTGAAVAAGLALAVGPRAIALLVPVLAVGLLHRRLKQFAAAKASYITLAWLVVVVGLPAALFSSAMHVGWVVAILGAAIGANAIASNVRDAEAGAARMGEQLALRVANLLAWGGVVLCAAGPRAIAGLAPVALLTAFALLGYRQSERYGLWVIDGALGVGAVLACAVFARAA
jgi:hypothetical protein